MTAYMFEEKKQKQKTTDQLILIKKNMKLTACMYIQYNNLNTYERNFKNDKFERGSNSIQIEIQ